MELDRLRLSIPQLQHNLQITLLLLLKLRLLIIRQLQWIPQIITLKQLHQQLLQQALLLTPQQLLLLAVNMKTQAIHLQQRLLIATSKRQLLLSQWKQQLILLGMIQIQQLILIPPQLLSQTHLTPLILHQADPLQIILILILQVHRVNNLNHLNLSLSLITTQSQFNTSKEKMGICTMLKLEKQCLDLLLKYIQMQMPTLMQMLMLQQTPMPMLMHIHSREEWIAILMAHHSLQDNMCLLLQTLIHLNLKEQILGSMHRLKVSQAIKLHIKEVSKIQLVMLNHCQLFQVEIVHMEVEAEAEEMEVAWIFITTLLFHWTLKARSMLEAQFLLSIHSKNHKAAVQVLKQRNRLQIQVKAIHLKPSLKVLREEVVVGLQIQVSW